MDLIVRRRGRAGAAAGAAADEPERLRLERAPDGGYDVQLGGRSFHVDAARVREGLYSLRLGGIQREVAVRRQQDGSYLVSEPQGATMVEVADPLAHLAAQSAGAGGARRRQRVTAYMPGRVVALLVAPGQEVAAGQGVLVLEAMKMQNEIQAEHAGTVTRFLVEAGQSVDGGDPLFELE